MIIVDEEWYGISGMYVKLMVSSRIWGFVVIIIIIIMMIIIIIIIILIDRGWCWVLLEDGYLFYCKGIGGDDVNWLFRFVVVILVVDVDDFGIDREWLRLLLLLL